MLAGVLLTLFFAWNVSQTFEELEAKHTLLKQHTHFYINSWDVCFKHSVVIVGMFSCCCLFIMLCNGLKMREYKSYWLTDFPLIISWVHAKK